MAELVVLTAISAAIAPALFKPALTKCADALLKTDSAAGLKSAIMGDLKPKLEGLQRDLRDLDALLSSAESLNPIGQQNQNTLVRQWLETVKEAANFADNLLDDVSYDQLRRQVEGSYGTCSFGFRRKIGRKLHKFKSMTASIYKKAADIGLRPVELTNPATFHPPIADLRESADTSIVLGREVEEELIVTELSTNEKALGVIAIVGMSGVGKTTLARMIYDNEIVTTNYEDKTWIFVSQDFNHEKFLNEMLQSLTNQSHMLTNKDTMERMLKKCLEAKRYLLVLDGVWNTKEMKTTWCSIKSSLDKVTKVCAGSKVLVTTQSYDLAREMGAYSIHRIEVLSNANSWKLFKDQAFPDESRPQVLDLKDIGERIVKKCGGLPLAIKTLASVLKNKDKSEWEKVDGDQVWDLLVECQTKIMAWLVISFNYLPNAAIKRCFAHFSMIPKGFSFEEKFITKQWIAQGFIQPSETSDDSGIGRKYINSMIDSNLLQKARTEENKFTLHDLMHDLAVYVSMESSLIVWGSNERQKASAGVEHLAIYGGNTSNSVLNFQKGNTQSTLRTLICFSSSISIDLVTQARFLRQLHLYSCGLKQIPSSIGELKHLRILDLYDNPFKYLPRTIGRLYNLQVLRVQKCDRLVELPQEVTKLINLREIITEAVHIPTGIGKLKCLTHLPDIKLKAGDGSKLTELGTLKHVEGVVSIFGLENISSKEEAAGADLKNKKGITELGLIWTNEHGLKGVCGSGEEVMEGLQPHSNLKVLLVFDFLGKRFSPWLSDGLYLNNLTHLYLGRCKGSEELPKLGCLSSLKHILVSRMDNVKVIDERVAASSSKRNQRNLFPSLEKFELESMQILKEWFDPSGSGVSAFPCLQELSIKGCLSLVKVPTCFHSLKKLTVADIKSSEPLLMIIGSNSNKLTSLAIEDVKQLTCLSEPLLKCTSLRLLKIERCEQLVELPPTLKSMSCLETLKISNCGRLTSLPDIEGLSSLRTLVISLCSNITATPRGIESCASLETLDLSYSSKLNLIPDLASLSRLQELRVMDLSEHLSIPQLANQLSGLSNIVVGGGFMKVESLSCISQLPTSLKSFTLVGGFGIKSLPSELQSLTQLETLEVRGHEFKWSGPTFYLGFEEVISLPDWLRNLSSLQHLDIRFFRNLKKLPSLEAMRSLTRLRELSITGCPKLEKKCREGGEEWKKISHIPIIRINVEQEEDEDV